MVEVDGGQVYQIIRCDGNGEWDDCEVQAYEDRQPSGNKFRMTNRNIRAAEQRLQEAAGRRGDSRGMAGSAGNGAASPESSTPSQKSGSRSSQGDKQVVRSGTAAGQDGKWKVGDGLDVNQRAFWYPAQIIEAKGGKYKVHYEGYPSSDDEWVDESRMRPIGGYKVAAECNYEPPSPAVNSRTPFSEALAKRKIYDEYSWKANGTLSAPSKVGVTFLSFQMGRPYKNSVANVPGYGAQRKHAGAPAGATVYAFKSKHLVCEQYRDGVARRLVEGSYACFVDRDDSWTCPSENDTKITQLDQE